MLLESILSVVTGGATGVIGALLGKAFSFLDYWVDEKKKVNEHGRTLEMLELQNKIGAQENEREMAVAQANSDADIRLASYAHDTSSGSGSPWVVDIIRLVRPLLTFSLIVIVAVIYFNEPIARDSIEQSVLYMASTAVLWWFGDRTLRKK